VSCPYEPDVLRLTDGELTTERRFLVEAHLAVCPSCAQIEAALDLVEQTLRDAPAAPLGVVARTLTTLPARRRIGVRMAMAALVLVAASAALFYTPDKPASHTAHQPEPTPIAASDDLPLPRSTTNLRDLLASATFDSTATTRRIADEFVRAGAPGSTALARMLTEDDRELQRRALAVAAFSPSSHYVDAAATLLADEEFGPAAARLLGQIGSTQAAPALERALDGRHAIEAREALVAIGGSQVAAVLLKRARATRDADLADALARTAPADAVRLMTDSDEPAFDSVLRQRRELLLPALREAGRAHDPRRAAAAARLLGRAGDTESIELLRRLARDLRTRPAAVEALVAIGSEPALDAAIAVCYRAGDESGLDTHFDGARDAEPLLLQVLETGTVAQRTAALRLLARCGGDATLDRIEQTDWRGGLVRAAIETTGAIGTPRAVAILAEWAEQPALRTALIEALGATGESAAVPHLRALDRRHATRIAAALATIPHAESARALIELLDDDRSAKAAAESLARMEPKLVMPLLLESLARRSSARRAREVLVRMTGMDLGKEPEDWRRWWNTRS